MSYFFSFMTVFCLVVIALTLEKIYKIMKNQYEKNDKNSDKN